MDLPYAIGVAFDRMYKRTRKGGPQVNDIQIELNFQEQTPEPVPCFCRVTIDVRLEGYTKATESRRILVAKNFYKRSPNRHVYHTTSEALFAT